MRKYEKQLHELFDNSPHLTFLFIMKRGVGLTTKEGVNGFLYFRDSQLDLRFDSVLIGLMDEHGNQGETEEYRLEELLPRVRMGDSEPVPLYIDGTKSTSRWSRPLTDEDKERKGISILIDEQSEQLNVAEKQLLETERQIEEAQHKYDEMKSRLMQSIEAAEPSRMTILMEVLDSAYEKIAALKQQQSDLLYQIEEMTEAIIDAQRNCERIIEWANIFHICGKETQKMIAGYMLKRVEVSRGYHLRIQVNDFGIANALIDYPSIGKTSLPNQGTAEYDTY